MKRFIACALALSFFFVFLSPSVCAIADDESDASFWLNYWVEEHTGIDMTQIPTTAYGMSYADYIYRQTGYTVDYWVDNATNPAQFADNTNEYLQNTYYNNGEFLKDILSTTPIANTTAEKYYTSKENRIDSEGGINVSGDDYWHSVYNGLFSNNGYKPQYSQVNNNGVNGTYNGYTFSVSCLGVVRSDDSFYNSIDNTLFLNVFRGISCYSSVGRIYSFGESISRGYYAPVWQLTVNGNTCYGFGGSYASTRSEFTNNFEGYETTYYYINVTYNTPVGWNTEDWRLYFNGNAENMGSNTTPVLQPYQIGYINYNGNKVPVYTDPNLNPYTINDNGTVTYPNGDEEDIYVDPKEFAPEGDMYIVQYIVNNYYGDPNNPNNPFGGNPNGLTINDYDTENGTKTKDYTKAFDSIINWLQKIYNKETEIITYLKKICKGLPLPNEENEEEEENKFEDFADMLKLFNGSNNDGFKQQLLDKIAYSSIQANINNFSTALFGQRTFNDNGTVNTQFGSISVTETPELNYTFQGSTHNFWNDIYLLNSNGDLSRAKEYVRFFIIFSFFLSFFRNVPSLINNVGGILQVGQNVGSDTSSIQESLISDNLFNDMIDHNEFFGSPFPDGFEDNPLF